MEEQVNLNNQMAPWQNAAAFNTFWTYSYMSRASFYAQISPTYYDFYNRWVQQWMYWYDGWVPWFHVPDNGIQSTRIATALVDRVAKKVVGGRLMFKNVGKESNKPREINSALKFVSDWSKANNFSSVVKNATKYAAAGGTALVKLNKDSHGLWAEALRIDSFIPTVGFRGEVLEVKCFLQNFMNAGNKKNKSIDNYYVVEQRYFGAYTRRNSMVIQNAPLVRYVVHKNSGSITNGNYVSGNMNERIEFESLPKDIRQNILKCFGAIRFDEPILLPFVGSLGCELIKWTDGISNIPELPLGESLLSTLVPILMSYDYYFSAFDTDMYTGRARVLASSGVSSAKTGNFNSGLDSFMITRIPYVNGEDQKPIPLQFDLRSSSWTEIRNKLIQNIAIQTGLNISTIASFLQDNTAAKTAREISAEENETVGYVDDKREILERPFNRLLKLVTLNAGYTDEVALRWSGAGLTNRYTLAEILSMALSGGFISKLKAVQMFNFDDDEEQVNEEYERIENEQGDKLFNEENFETDDVAMEDGTDENGGQGAEFAGAGNRGSTSGNKGRN